MRETILIILIGAALTALVFTGAAYIYGWGSDTSAPLKQPESVVPVADRPLVPCRSVPEAERFHGVALQIHNTLDLASYYRAIDEIAATGADTVLLSTAAHQENGASSSIFPDVRKAPKQSEMAGFIRYARDRGLRVILMPILLLERPRGNEWRGKIDPDNPIAWWADYREFIRYYARAAAAAGADLFVVGSELNRMERSAQRWRDLIAYVRQDTDGKLKLAYSANWDRYWKVSFWDDLDYACVTSYYELADEEDPDPPVDKLEAAWRPHARDLVAWQRTVGKPVIFSEVGYFSRKGVASAPWNYYLNPGQPSQEAQDNLYKAFLNVWTDQGPRRPWPDLGNRAAQDIVGGIIFWEWTIFPGGPTDEGYTPRGKLAGRTMERYFGRYAHRPAPATAPDAE